MKPIRVLTRVASFWAALHIQHWGSGNTGNINPQLIQDHANDMLTVTPCFTLTFNMPLACPEILSISGRTVLEEYQTVGGSIMVSRFPA